MPIGDEDYWKLANQKVWEQDIRDLLASGNLVMLRKYVDSLQEYVKKENDPKEQSEALKTLQNQFKKTLQFKAIELFRLIENYPWESEKQLLTEGSLDIKKLYSELSIAWPDVAKRDSREKLQKNYKWLLQQKNSQVKYLDEDFEGYASDDSDEEDEDKSESLVKSRKLLSDNDIPEFVFKSRPKKKTFRVHEGLDPNPHWVRSKAYEMLEQKEMWDDERYTFNAQIHHGEDWTEQVESDFKLAQKIFADLMNTELNIKATSKEKQEARELAKIEFGQLKTKFAFAQYRGITYKTSGFDRRARQSSRETVEVGMAIYSFAVFAEARVSPAKYFSGQCTEKELLQLELKAQNLKDLLVNKRDTGPFEYLNYVFDSQAHALQDVYTNNYDYFHSAIQLYIATEKGWFKKRLEKVEKELQDDENFKKIQSEKVKQHKIFQMVYGFEPPKSWAPYEGLKNAECPFVSTGDVPRHALKYAYGKKFYEGHYHERLLPRWNKYGRAERPYSGKVFVSLHSLSDYIDDAPLHVRSLNNLGKIRIGAAIAGERESTFPAYIPAGRMIIEHIAKLPSFREGGYKKLYLEKYGIDEEDYERYAELIQKNSTQEKLYGAHKNPKYREKPEIGEDDRSEEEKKKTIEHTGGSLIQLDSWLVNFHEVRLIELARQMALKKGMILIYRDEYGHLSSELPVPLNEETEFLLKEKESRTKGKRSFDKRLVDVSGQLRKRPLQESLDEAFTVKGTPSDGNCLFHALAAAYQKASNNSYKHEKLREIICRVFRTTPALRNRFRITSKYLQEMEQVAQNALDYNRWGSDSEITAFCWHFHVRVRVFSYTYPAPYYYADFEKFGDNIAHTLYLFNRGGNHWEWLIPK